MMVGAAVTVAIVIIVFFLAGVGFGVFWILAKSVRLDRTPEPRKERMPEPDEDPDEPDSGQKSWPFQH